MESTAFACQVCRYDFCHFVAGRDEPVDHASVQRYFADGENVRVAGAQRVIDQDAATLTDFQSAVASEIIARTNTGRYDDHVHVQAFVVGELHALNALLAKDLLGGLVEVYADTELLDFLDENVGAGLVDLARHQSRREFDHVCFQIEIVRCFGRFEAEQTAADDRGSAGLFGVGNDVFQIFDRTVDEDTGFFDSRNRGHERV